MSPTSATEDRELIQSAIEALQQGERLLEEISDEVYTLKISVAFGATIGGHYRHCLDHFRILLDSASAGDLNYDRRDRGTPVESHRLVALAASRELREGYEQLDPALLARPLAVTCKTSYTARGSQVWPSTVGREIMYSVAHAVHHYAVISVIGAIMGIPLPPGFGVAPSTLKHQAQNRQTTA